MKSSNTSILAADDMVMVMVMVGVSIVAVYEVGCFMTLPVCC